MTTSDHQEELEGQEGSSRRPPEVQSPAGSLMLEVWPPGLGVKERLLSSATKLAAICRGSPSTRMQVPSLGTLRVREIQWTGT